MKGLIGKCVIVYLDNILVFSQTKDEHLRHLHHVLRKLQQEKLIINLQKCTCMKEELVYLGFVISREGLKMDQEKVKEILEWPSPKNISEVRSFLDYQAFIGNS